MITEACVASLEVKRHRLGESWPVVIHPPKAGSDYTIVLPFEESLVFAFDKMTTLPRSRVFINPNNVAFYLQGTAADEKAPAEAVAWVEALKPFVVMRDCMALSFALDFDRAQGHPARPQTEIGQLRTQAKPYNAPATNAHYQAAAALASRCVSFLEIMTCYADADCVVGMPPSDPGKQYRLPAVLAAIIASGRKCEDLTDAVRTLAPRPGLRGLPVAAKLGVLRGTIEVEAARFQGRTVLLVDDLYQSGTSMNYCALQLQQAGATHIFGLACEKTCRNDDNVSRTG